MASLDEHLWQRTPLGTVGPTGFLSLYAAGDTEVVYASLDDTSLERPPYPDAVAALVHTVRGRRDLSGIKTITDVCAGILDDGIHTPDTTSG